MKTTITTLLVSALVAGCSYGSRYETAYEAKSACEQRAEELTSVGFNSKTSNFEADFIEPKCIRNETTNEFMLQAIRIERHECNYKCGQTSKQKCWCQTSEDMRRGYEIEFLEPAITERFAYQ